MRGQKRPYLYELVLNEWKREWKNDSNNFFLISCLRTHVLEFYNCFAKFPRLTVYYKIIHIDRCKNYDNEFCEDNQSSDRVLLNVVYSPNNV